MGLSRVHGDDGTIEKKRGQGAAEIEGGVRDKGRLGRTFERLAPVAPPSETRMSCNRASA